MSNLREMAKEQQQELLNKDQQMSNQRDKGLGRVGTILLQSKIPTTMSEWAPKEGEHIIDVVPYISGNVDIEAPGKLRWMIFLYDHTYIGALNDAFVCPAYNFREKCPIEEYLSSHRLPKDEWSGVKAKERNILFVWVHDNLEEEAKGVQIWKVADFFFGKKIDKLAKLPRGGGYVPFWSPDTGKSIWFEIEGSRENQSWDGHKFIDRDGPLPDKILNQTFALDEAINWHPSYDEIYNAFPYTEGVVLSSEEIDRGKQEEAQGKFFPSTESERPDTLQERKEKDREPPPPPTPEGKCPSGYTIGVDIDTKPECDGCSEWDSCFDIKESMDKSESGRLVK